MLDGIRRLGWANGDWGIILHADFRVAWVWGHLCNHFVIVILLSLLVIVMSYAGGRVCHNSYELW